MESDKQLYLFLHVNKYNFDRDVCFHTRTHTDTDWGLTTCKFLSIVHSKTKER